MKITKMAMATLVLMQRSSTEAKNHLQHQISPDSTVVQSHIDELWHWARPEPMLE